MIFNKAWHSFAVGKRSCGKKILTFLLVRSTWHILFLISLYSFNYCSSILVLGINSSWEHQKRYSYFIYILEYDHKQVGMCCLHERRSWELSVELKKNGSSSSLSATQGTRKVLNVLYSGADTLVSPMVPGGSAKYAVCAN